MECKQKMEISRTLKKCTWLLSQSSGNRQHRNTSNSNTLLKNALISIFLIRLYLDSVPALNFAIAYSVFTCLYACHFDEERKTRKCW